MPKSRINLKKRYPFTAIQFFNLRSPKNCSKGTSCLSFLIVMDGKEVVLMSPEGAQKIYMRGCDAVVKTICDLSKKNEKLQGENLKLKEKISTLSKNSSNSGKSPSSDDITKHRKKNTGRKIGGQPGHPKHERRPYPEEEVDIVTPWAIAACPICKGQVRLSTDLPPIPLQQVDKAEKPVIVEEHRSYAFWYENCQKYHYAPFPPHVIKEGLFKAQVMAVVAYMKNVQHSSFSNIRKFFFGMF